MNTVYCKVCTRAILRWEVDAGAVRIDDHHDIPLTGSELPFVVPFVVAGHRLQAVAASPPPELPYPMMVTVEQIGCPASGSVGQPPALGEVVRSILDDAPRLETGVVTLARSRSELYAATPWSAAVTGGHAIVAAVQSFAHKGMADPARKGAFCLPLLARLRRFETMQIERRDDSLVRLTVRTATEGRSAWSSDFAPAQTSFDAETLDAVLVGLIDQLYPPLGELEDVRGVVGKMRTHGLVDEYLGQLANDWVYRWLSRRRRSVADSTVDEEVAALSRALVTDEDLVRSMVCPRRPAVYPCGCSIVKVDAGLCDEYQPGENPR